MKKVFLICILIIIVSWSCGGYDRIKIHRSEFKSVKWTAKKYQRQSGLQKPTYTEIFWKENKGKIEFEYIIENNEKKIHEVKFRTTDTLYLWHPTDTLPGAIIDIDNILSDVSPVGGFGGFLLNFLDERMKKQYKDDQQKFRVPFDRILFQKEKNGKIVGNLTIDGHDCTHVKWTIEEDTGDEPGYIRNLWVDSSGLVRLFSDTMISQGQWVEYSICSNFAYNEEIPDTLYDLPRNKTFGTHSLYYQQYNNQSTRPLPTHITPKTETNNTKKIPVFFLVVIGVTGFCISYKLSKKAPSRHYQLIITLVAIGFFIYAFGSSAVYVICFMLIYIYIVLGFISYPAKYTTEIVNNIDLKGYRYIDELKQFTPRNGFEPLIEFKEQIMSNAAVYHKIFSKEDRIFLMLEKQVFRGKTSFWIFFSSFFMDGSSINTTNYLGNFDQRYPEKHPIYQIKTSSLDELFRCHHEFISRKKAVANETTIKEDCYVQNASRIYDEIFQRLCRLGYWKRVKDRYKHTFKGKLNAIGRYFNFLNLLKKERIS